MTQPQIPSLRKTTGISAGSFSKAGGASLDDVGAGSKYA